MKRHLKKGDFKKFMLSRFWLRTHFLVMLLLTALLTLGASHLLLALGLQNIMVRYVLSLAFSYICFLILLRVWLGLYIFPSTEWELPGTPHDLDLPLVTATAEGVEVSPHFQGEGGGFSGGGASGAWEGSETPKAILSRMPDLDEDSAPVVLPLLVIVGLAAAALMLFSFVGVAIYSAPVILCEVALEMAVTIGIVRLSLKEKDLSKGSWLRAALRHTALPFAFFVIVIMTALWWVGRYHPGLTRLSDIWLLVAR